MSVPKISSSANSPINSDKGKLAENFGRLTSDLIFIFLTKLNSHNEVRKCLCVHRTFEPTDKNFWPSLLNQYFPFSYKKYGLTQYGKLQFAHLSRIDNHIRNEKCFYKEVKIVAELFRSEPNTSLRLDNALKFSNGKVFHTGFGDYGWPSQDNTTIDVHDISSSELDLEKRINSIRIPRKDIICTHVHGNEVYLGTDKGDLLCANPMQSHAQTLIGGIGRSISCIQFYQGFVYCTASTDNNHSLLIYEVQSKTVKTLELKSKIVGLQIYEENLYCIAENGDIDIVDLKTRDITDQVKLDVTVDSFPLIIEGFLYVFFDELSVWDIKTKQLSYCYEHEKHRISAVTAHREYVFVGLYDGSIQVLHRRTGEFISTIYPPATSVCPIHGLNVDRDTLYAYTLLGEIVMIKLDDGFHSGFTQGVTNTFRILRHGDLNIDLYNLSKGPNRLWF